MNYRHSFRSATYVFLINENKVLLARRYNTGYKDGQYSTMAGHLESNETIIDCAIREAKEEAVIAVNEKNLHLFHIMNRNSDFDYIDFFFWTDRWEGVPTIGEPNLCDDMRWFNLDQIPANTIDYIREVLTYYQKSIIYSKYGE